MNRPPLTVRIPLLPDPGVGVRLSDEPGYVVLEWRYADVLKRETLHLDDLRNALAQLDPARPCDHTQSLPGGRARSGMAEQITTREELDAQPVGVVVLDRHGKAWQRTSPFAWTGAESLRLHRLKAEFTLPGALPATVLYRPDASDAPAPSAEEACDHADSLYGRCTRCGETWEQQAAAGQPAPVVSAAVADLSWSLDHMDDGAQIVFRSGLEVPLSEVRDALHRALAGVRHDG